MFKRLLTLPLVTTHISANESVGSLKFGDAVDNDKDKE